MTKKLCIFTVGFAFNRQVMLNFFEKIMQKNMEIFLFVPKECKGKFKSKKIIIYESKMSKYFFIMLARYILLVKLNILYYYSNILHSYLIMYVYYIYLLSLYLIIYYYNSLIINYYYNK